MRFSCRYWRPIRVLVALGLVALALSACGSNGASPTGSGGGSVISGLKQSGPGFTKPTAGTGTKVSGGTATFAESPGAPPNYIFPMMSPEYCDTNNQQQLNVLLYRPLYWYGDNYSPTVDYADSIGQKPVFSSDDKVVTIHLNHYKWSDGETVSARDLVFWMNLVKADPAKEWCGYVPGKFPTNVRSYTAVNSTTFRIVFDHSYNPTWVLYNELSQLYPLPMAWDRTSLSQKAPNPNAPHLPDTTKQGASAVYNLLNAQSQRISSWGSSPLWSIVDGPWKVQSTTSTGQVTFVPNKDYSGSPKASLAKFVEIPFTSESAMVDQIKSQGSKSLTVAYIPSQYEPLTSSFESEGYTVNSGTTYGTNFVVLNEHAPKVGVVFQQLYARQALQHLVDEKGWIDHFLHGVALPTYGPVPVSPASKLASSSSEKDLYPFSISAAAKLLKGHGWKVVSGGQSVCMRPGVGRGECGKGIAKGQPFTFTLNYLSDVTSVEQEMEDLQSQASKVGIKISLTTHPFSDVSAATVHCASGSGACDWDANNYGAGWVWGTSHYPSGEFLFDSQSVDNDANYTSAHMDKLINSTIYASAAKEPSAMRAFVNYAAQQVPYLWVPQSVGAFGTGDAGTLVAKNLGGYSDNAFGAVTPEDWYFTK